MKKGISLFISSLILVGGLAFPAKAAYYTDNTPYKHPNFSGKLNLYVSNGQRYGLAGTYHKQNRIMYYMDAVLRDNGSTIDVASDYQTDGVTTDTFKVANSGVTSKHCVQEKKGGWEWVAYL